MADAKPLTPAQQAAERAAAAARQNASARAAIWAHGKPILQFVTSKTFATVTAGQNVLSLNPNPIGFLQSFIVEVTGTITNTGAGTLTLTPNGADNLLSNITFNDFTGNPRHNCSGRSLSFVEAMKYARTPGAAQTSDSVSGFGSIVASNVAPSSIANAGSGTVTRVFEVPIMLDDKHNMQGGLWLGVNNQSTQLNLSLNTAPVAVTGNDPLTAIYTGTSGTLTNVTINVWQKFWNNVPTYKGTNRPFLPAQDLAMAYMITETNAGFALSANNPAYWNYPTFSKILGTYFTYDNGGALNAGTDISSIALQVSNYQNIRQYNPFSLDREIRDIISTSFPKGSYGIYSRDHLLDVDQYPSLQLQFTPTSVGANSYVLVTTELLRPVAYMAAASGVGGA